MLERAHLLIGLYLYRHHMYYMYHICYHMYYVYYMCHVYYMYYMYDMYWTYNPPTPGIELRFLVPLSFFLVALNPQAAWFHARFGSTGLLDPQAFQIQGSMDPYAFWIHAPGA